MGIADIIVAVVVLMIVAIIAIVGITLMDAIENEPQFNDSITPLGYSAFNTARNSMYVWDYAGVFLLFGIIAVAVMSAAFVNSHPIFFVATLLFMLVFTVTSTILTNIYNQVAGDTLLASVANNFPWTMTAFQWLPLIGLVGMVAFAIAMFGKAGRTK